MNNKPEIAIIESNTLTCLGLKSILEEIIPMATIRTFHSFNELMDDTTSSRRKSMLNTMPSSSPESEKQLCWPVTARNSNCRVCLCSISTNPKKNW